MRNQWRVGRSLGRTLYIMVGDEPSKDDTFVGVMDTRELAQRVVDAVNLERVVPPELEEPTFPEALSMVLNRHSRENDSNTPDYVLAKYLLDCLDAFADATRGRDLWYNIEPKPGWEGGRG